MSFFEFPFTRTYSDDLGWLIRKVREVEDIALTKSLKYADPIQWNITSQYALNTIVIDPLTGVAYMSVQDVPSGILLTDSDYWTPVFDLGRFVTKMAKNLANIVEAETTLTATVPSDLNDWLIWGDTLYRVINPAGIIIGDQYVVGSNIEEFTIENIIGHIEDLSTTDKTNIVSAINEVISTLISTTGDLDNLSTTDKTSLVNAINEVLAALIGTKGDLRDLSTVVNNLNVYNVKDYGATGDGVTDDSSAVIAAYNDIPESGGILYFPAGKYQLNSAVEVYKPITVYFADATILCGASLANFQIHISNVEFRGKGNFGNNGGARLALIFDGFTNIVFDMDCNVVGFISEPLITSVKNAFVVVKGKYSTQDSMIFLSNGSSYVDVSGVMALYTTTPALGSIVCTDSDTKHTYSHVNIHDNFVEGGGVLVNGCITVTRSEQTDGVSGKNYIPIKDVKITDNTVMNTAGITDGIDILFCDGVTVVNNNVNKCFEGIAILADNVVVANCICTENRSAGIYIGDLNIGRSSTHWDMITITNCIMADNGYGTDTYARNAALASDQPESCYTSSVYIENSFMFGSEWALYFGDNTSGSNIRVSNCYTVGSLGALRYIEGQESQFKMTNNAGYNPLGFIKPPTISTTPVSNDTTTDVWVTIMNSNTAQTVNINGTPLAAIPANSTYGLMLPKGEKINLSNDATDCSWSWYAL